MTGDAAIRRLTAAAVLLVALIAAVVSFIHIERLAVTHGQTMLASALLPVSIDGTVAAASLVMLRAARAGLSVPWLARFGLGLAVAATLAANVGYGIAYGTTGALISGWPAIAFILCAEMAIGMLRRDRAAGISSKTKFAGDAELAPVPSTVIEAAKASMRATVAAGNPYSVNQLQEKFSLTRAAATKLRRELLAEANGHQAAIEP